jgi:hypothetical protein
MANVMVHLGRRTLPGAAGELVTDTKEQQRHRASGSRLTTTAHIASESAMR